MGRLRNVHTGAVWPMPSRMLLGRSATCFLQLQHSSVSGEHALIRWADSGWTVRDLGSKNGTRLDEVWLDPRRTVELRAGAHLELADSGERWLVESAEPPEAMAMALEDRVVRVSARGLLALPSDEDPQATLYAAPDGRWLIEGPEGEAEVGRREVLSAGGRSWRLFLPSSFEGTPMVEGTLALESVDFRFYVSSNEEVVDLSIVQHGREIRLETCDYNYLLLTLARARLADRPKAVEERGWLSAQALSRMLKKGANALDVATHRARRGLLEAGLVGAQRVVESRRSSRRFGSDRIDIRPR